jgi:hypothetical protein
MNPSRRLAGLGLTLQGIFFVIVLVIIFGVLPGLGFQGPADFANPAKVLPFAASQPLIAFWLLPGDILFSIFLILAVVALNEHLNSQSAGLLLRLATAAGLVATTLILANGALGTSFMALAQGYPQNKATADTAYGVLSLVSSNGVGLIGGGLFAYGWWAAGVSLVALRGHLFPPILNYLGLLFGVAGILALFIPPLGILGPVVGLVWCLWLGLLLLRG